MCRRVVPVFFAFSGLRPARPIRVSPRSAASTGTTALPQGQVIDRVVLVYYRTIEKRDLLFLKKSLMFILTDRYVEPRRLESAAQTSILRLLGQKDTCTTSRRPRSEP
jgi:hypothetical protein